ncbi:hypothetical protein SAMN04490248_106133 [Salinihabitans flavidus]|uniref:DUF2155 domain-containing protein n=1 Tax=Salinihabitans flavidus TaxID=569882 RepID=A0A1H8QF24_9RHOB|nr:DUF2155 domain-containing protein [Salinihabitans flavidus]SEO52618.1 hypothetical protein SAMN04490248_106133 [Salinihabitans flavidus]
MRLFAISLLLCWAGLAQAQEIVVEPLDDPETDTQSGPSITEDDIPTFNRDGPRIEIEEMPRANPDAPSITEDYYQSPITLSPGFGQTEETVIQQEVAQSPGAVLRGIDRLSGEVEDFEIQSGHSARLEKLRIELSDCRHPVDNPTGEAFAFLTVRDEAEADPLFQGWMIASSPALNALDHARYDIWVLRCITS